MNFLQLPFYRKLPQALFCVQPLSEKSHLLVGWCNRLRASRSFRQTGEGYVTSHHCKTRKHPKIAESGSGEVWAADAGNVCGRHGVMLTGRLGPVSQGFRGISMTESVGNLAAPRIRQAKWNVLL